MNKHSKYRPLMNDIQDKICNAEIGVTGLYRLMLETLDEAEQELATLKASLPKIKADAVRELIREEITVGRLHNDQKRSFIFVSDASKYANKLEAGE